MALILLGSRAVLLLSLQLFQVPVIPPRVLLLLSSLQPFQAVTSRLLIGQFNLQQLQVAPELQAAPC